MRNSLRDLDAHGDRMYDHSRGDGSVRSREEIRKFGRDDVRDASRDSFTGSRKDGAFTSRDLHRDQNRSAPRDSVRGDLIDQNPPLRDGKEGRNILYRNNPSGRSNIHSSTVNEPNARKDNKWNPKTDDREKR